VTPFIARLFLTTDLSQGYCGSVLRCAAAGPVRSSRVLHSSAGSIVAEKGQLSCVYRSIDIATAELADPEVNASSAPTDRVNLVKAGFEALATLTGAFDEQAREDLRGVAMALYYGEKQCAVFFVTLLIIDTQSCSKTSPPT
jgi:hypothetical protein